MSQFNSDTPLRHIILTPRRPVLALPVMPNARQDKDKMTGKEDHSHEIRNGKPPKRRGSSLKPIITGASCVILLITAIRLLSEFDYENLFDIAYAKTRIKSDSRENSTISNSSVWSGNHSSDYIMRNISYRQLPSTQSVSEVRNLQLHLNLGVFEPASNQVTTDTKIILWYTPTRYHPVLENLHPLRSCPDSPCRVTTNKYFYNQSEALVFTAERLETRPPPKLQTQVWILHNHEPPNPRWANTRHPLYNVYWKSKFNWTLDYRFDADIYNPYGIFKMKDGVFEKRQLSTEKNYTEILSLKSSNASIAWMVSHCHVPSKRMKYVKRLQKYVNVDVYGNCGTRHCSRHEDHECLKDISKHYKFYLAFENNFCKDYVTEKFFRYFNSDMVLIVRGGGTYSKIAPPGTYINTENFKSVKALADYINMLNNDDEKYLRMLRLKDQYESVFEDWPTVKKGRIVYMTYHYDAVPMCEVCKRLWNTDKYRKHYNDITRWFNKGRCYQPNDY